MDEVEALARAYCREVDLDPDALAEIKDQGPLTRMWRLFEDEARDRLAWSKAIDWARAMEAVKRDE